MLNINIFITAFLAAIVLSFTLSLVFKRLALKYHLLPKIRIRDAHQKPLPRIGGLAIFLSFLIVSVVWFLFITPDIHFTKASVAGIDHQLLGIWLATFLITGLMFLDDLRGLSAPVKLLVQIMAALIIIASGVGIDTLANPFGQPFNLNSIYIPIFKYQGITYHFSLLSDLLTLIWLVGMMNVINFIDGIDGLAAGISGIAAGVIFLLSMTVFVNQPATALLAIILAGAAFGFLPLNFYPAKIFMGDLGSMFLGLMLGVLPLISGGKLATAFLVLGFPIVDGLVVTFSRLLRGLNPLTTPDKTHLHHRFISAGFSVRQAVIAMYLIAILFGWVALRSTTRTKLEAGALLIVSLIVMIMILSKIKIQKSK